MYIHMYMYYFCIGTMYVGPLCATCCLHVHGVIGPMCAGLCVRCMYMYNHAVVLTFCLSLSLCMCMLCQHNDFQILHEMGLSEEEQLTMALELSMQGRGLIHSGGTPYRISVHMRLILHTWVYVIHHS